MITKAQYSNMKRHLTTVANRLKKAKDPADVVLAADSVISEVDWSRKVFDAEGYPDDWARWERAKDDAEMAKWRALRRI